MPLPVAPLAQSRARKKHASPHCRAQHPVPQHCSLLNCQGWAGKRSPFQQNRRPKLEKCSGTDKWWLKGCAMLAHRARRKRRRRRRRRRREGERREERRTKPDKLRVLRLHWESQGTSITMSKSRIIVARSPCPCPCPYHVIGSGTAHALHHWHPRTCLGAGTVGETWTCRLHPVQGHRRRLQRRPGLGRDGQILRRARTRSAPPAPASQE
jgi:hypothetical protein